MNDDAPIRPPWSAVVATLIAYFALFLSASSSVSTRLMLGAFTLAILGSYATKARFNGRLLPRIVLLSLVILLNPSDSNGAFDQFGPAYIRNIFGLFPAGEAMLQFWQERRQSTGDTASASGETDAARSYMWILFAAGLTFLSASNTFDERFVRWITPPFFLSLALLARSYRPRRVGGKNGETALPRIALLLQSFALIGTLGLGIASYTATIRYRGELMDLTNQWLFRSQFRTERTIMASQPILGPLFNLRGSPARILRIVRFTGDPHWRGLSFDTYHKGVWDPAMSGRRWQNATSDDLQQTGTRAPRSTSDMTVTRLVTDNPFVYAPLSVSSIDPGTDVTNIRWSPLAGGPIRIASRGTYDYTITIPTDPYQIETHQGLLAARLTQETRKLHVAVPTDESELNAVRTLALKIVSGKRSDAAKIAAVINYLQANHPYSLQFVPDGKGTDPVADFLATPRKGGHCEFFAASAALLLRYADVPTRYTTGYYVHESGGKGVMIVRQRDAHAWCEAWVKNVGWVTVDATPSDGRPDGDTEEIEPWRKSWEWAQDRWQAFSELLANLTPEQISLAMSVVLAGAVLYAIGFVLLRRRRRLAQEAASVKPDGYSGDPSLTELARRFESIWERAGEPPFPASRTYAEALRAGAESEADPNLQRLARDWAREYDTARFGGYDDSAVRLRLQKLLTEMEQQFSHADDRRR